VDYAVSTDGVHWTPGANGSVLNVTPGAWDSYTLSPGPVVHDASGYRMWYAATADQMVWRVGLATSPDGIHWTKYAGNPIIVPPFAGSWDDFRVTPSCVLVEDGQLVMWYVSDDTNLTQRIGVAYSEDGIHWTPSPAPALDVGDNGSWDEGSLSRVSVLQQGTLLRMWYTGLDTRSGFTGHWAIGLATATTNESVPPPPSPVLSATIAAHPTEGTMPLTVTFNSTVTGGVAPYTYDWQLGDGATTTAANTVHIYLTGGNFTVRLTVYDSENGSVFSNVLWVNVTSAAVNLSVIPISPTEFTASSNGITATLAATVSGGAPPYTFSWAFGDGTTGRGAHPVHTYASPGLYTVTVTVTDAQGHSVSRSFELNVPALTGPGPSMTFPAVLVLAAVAGSAVAVALGTVLFLRSRKGRPPT